MELSSGPCDFEHPGSDLKDDNLSMFRCLRAGQIMSGPTMQENREDG